MARSLASERFSMEACPPLAVHFQARLVSSTASCSPARAVPVNVNPASVTRPEVSPESESYPATG